LDIWIGHINLAVSTGEPFIPLQMEKQTWLSEEALGPLMSEYLFIRYFYQKATNDPNFWLDDRFTVLLEKIRYYTPGKNSWTLYFEYISTIKSHSFKSNYIFGKRMEFSITLYNMGFSVDLFINKIN
jgi:hypothetical protein